MRRWAVVLSAVTISLGAASAVTGATANAGSTDPYTASDGHAQAGPMAGIVPSRDSNPGDAHSSRPRGGGSSPNLTWHGGGVQTTGSTVYPVFWGTSWTTGSTVVSAMDTFYAGVGGTTYMGTNKEYTNGGGTAPNYVGTAVSTAVSGGANYYDNNAAPTSSPSTSSVLAAVVAATHGQLVAGAYYPVYADTPRGRANYCAWHSSGSYNGVQIQFGFFWKLDNDAGCNPQDPYSLHPEGIDALGNVSGHELSEMTTDPQLNAWYDSQGSENADKCAWTFNGSETFSNQTQWYIQGNWSNNAYNNNQGYTYNGTFDRGCINSG